MDYLGLDEEIMRNLEMARKANQAVQSGNLDYALGIFTKVCYILYLHSLLSLSVHRYYTLIYMLGDHFLVYMYSMQIVYRLLVHIHFMSILGHVL
jgi:hypothetical protein